MKKTAYISPATDITYLETGKLLSVSAPTSTNVDGLGVSEEEYEGEGHSRRRTVWDDEELEEEEEF